MVDRITTFQRYFATNLILPLTAWYFDIGQSNWSQAGLFWFGIAIDLYLDEGQSKKNKEERTRVSLMALFASVLVATLLLNQPLGHGVAEILSKMSYMAWVKIQ